MQTALMQEAILGRSTKRIKVVLYFGHRFATHIVLIGMLLFDKFSYG
jgi:hypothetical protein